MKDNQIRGNIEEKYIEMQYKLQKQIDFQNVINPVSIQKVAGVDLAYWNKDGEEYATCCIVVLDYVTKDVVEKKYVVERVKVPYIPGCLAFREIPVFLKVYEMLDADVDIIFFDGNGYLHPRHMGLATHAGILINKPTIGIAKSYLKIKNIEFNMPETKQFAYTDIIIDDEIYGRVLRTHSEVKPIFLSIGNKIDLDTAMEITNMLVTKDSHIPLPTRLADIMTHEVRKKYI